MSEHGMRTSLSVPAAALCDWCRHELADGLLNGDPCCLSCADGIIIDGQPPLSVQLAIEERAPRPHRRSKPLPADFYLRTPEKWLAENGWYGPPTFDVDWDIPF